MEYVEDLGSLDNNDMDFDENDNNDLNQVNRERVDKKDINKCINSVKTLLAETLKKSQKQRFNGMYSDILKKIDNDKKPTSKKGYNQHGNYSQYGHVGNSGQGGHNHHNKYNPNNQHSQYNQLNQHNNSQYDQQGNQNTQHQKKKGCDDNIGILEYDFLKPTTKNKKGGARYSQSPKRVLSEKSVCSPSTSPKRESSQKMDLRDTKDLGNSSSPMKKTVLKQVEEEHENLSLNNLVNSNNNQNKNSNAVNNTKKLNTATFSLNLSSNFNANANVYANVNANAKSSSNPNPNNNNNKPPNIESDNSEDIDLDNMDVYSRNLYYQKKKEKILIRQRKEKQQEEIKSMLGKPVVSKNSQKIIRDKLSNEKPIYERFHVIVNNKKQNLHTIKKEVKNEAEEKFIKEASKRLRKEFNPNQSVFYDPTRFDGWVKEKRDWVQKRKDKVSNLKQYYQNLENEDNELTFKPTINKMSEKLAEHKFKISTTMELSERLYNDYYTHMSKRQEMQTQYMPSFQPKVNNKLPKYLKDSREDKENNDNIDYTEKIINKEGMVENVFEDNYERRNMFVNIGDIREEELIKPTLNLQKSQPLLKVKDQKFKKLDNNELKGGNFLADDIELNQVKAVRVISKKESNKSNVSNMSHLSNSAYNQYRENKEKNKEESKINDSLYRINIRDASVWDINKENNVMYNPSFDFVFKSQ